MNDWLTAKEIAEINVQIGVEPKTDRGVQKKATAEQWSPYRDVPAKGGPGGLRREYHLSSLPAPTRDHLLTLSATPANSPVPEPETLQDMESYLSTRRITLSPQQLSNPKMQAKIAVARAVNACPAYGGRETLIARLAEQHRVSNITIRRWVDYVETLPARTTTPRVKLGDERIDIPESTAFSQEALAYGLSTYANNIRAGIKAAYRAMQSQAERRGWRIGDYSNFTRTVHKIPEAVWVYIRKGKTGFELACAPKIIREWTKVPVQTIICGDQKIFDYEVYDPEGGRIIIPNGYFWMDCSSRMINGAWVELGHYNSYTVGASLREALHYGIPGEIFTDWGKPENSHHIAHVLKALSTLSLTGDFSAMSEKYGDMDAVDHHKAPAGEPWKKPIENLMNIIDHILADKFIGGFRKRNNDAWVNKVIQARLKRDRKFIMPATRPASREEARGLMTIEQFIHTIYTCVDEHNAKQKTIKEGGSIVPESFFLRGLVAAKPPVLADRTLNYVCMPYKDITPRNATCLLQAGTDDYRGYYSSALATVKEKVRVSYNPYDRKEPAVLTDISSGEIIDIGDPHHSQHPKDNEGLSEKIQRKAELMRWVGECARRVREAFDLKLADERGDAPAPVERIGQASVVAKEAAQAKRVYELRQVNDRRIEKDHARQGSEGLKKLIAEMESAPEFTVPGNSKERYRLWCILDGRTSAGHRLTDPEAEFWNSYQKNAEWRVHRELHEEFGEGYIDIGPKPEMLKIVN